MIGRLLGEVWAEMRTASAERWTLAGTAVGTAIVLAAVVRVEQPLLLVALIAFAVVAALQPASNAGLIVMAIVVLRWVTDGDDRTGPTSILLAVGLVAFHLTLAAMASLPVAATTDRALRRRWMLRFGVLTAATVTTWALVRLLSLRPPAANTLLASAALLAVAAGALAVREAGADRS